MSDKIIFLVEDNPDDEALTLRAFKKNNIMNQVVIAHDGVEAINYLLGPDSANNLIPQIILLDLNLPKMDGLEVLKRLRSDERTKLLPIIILTSSREEQDLLNSYDLGANSYIRKPVDFNQFIAAVQQLGLYWLVLNEIPPVRR
ncbi:response regulator [Sporomusa sp. KB1]|jgi:CheY-like chemotaxis protein|uniref:response regulator n=1 Tax=Sporomusa sp. KB1 TaxID=943346 RepID=UPI0011A2A58C|nr:response regulator [Sporomusa sp. KB1]TWH46662.1 Response regulators consisting of a CheY-like receiver domain and a winged-helix DNA-binding domain [Sporomusa sp. KB1]